MRRTLVLGIVAGLLCAAALPARAADPEETANRIARQVMSPFCPGLTLHDCPSDPALDLREQIRDWAAAGWSEERIIETLESEYGEENIRATPPTSGAGLVAWALPGLALVAGLVGALVLGRRWTRRGDRADPDVEETLDPLDRQRLEAELARVRQEES